MKIVRIIGVAFSAILFWGAAATASAQTPADEGDYIKKKDVTAVAPLPADLQAQAKEIVDGFANDPEKAGEDFLKMMRKVKDKELYVGLGRYFIDNKNYQCAKICVDQAYKADPTYVPGLILFGDVCAMRHDWGMAGQKYDEALLQDSMLVGVLLKSAGVYKWVNPEVSKEYLARLKRIDPKFYEADRQLGDIYYNANEFKNAVKSYKIYADSEPDPKLSALGNYALALYFTNKFDESLEVANKVLKKDSTVLNMKRLRFYNLYETKDMDGAVKAMSFMNDKSLPDSTFTYDDYNYKGKVCESIDSISDAIAAYKKALEIRPSGFPTIKSLAIIYRKKQDYPLALSTYKIYLDSLGKKATLNDSLELGRTYMLALGDAGDKVTKEMKEQYVKDGDYIFARASEIDKENHIGPYYRARINNLLDPDNPHENVFEYYKETYKRLKAANKLTSIQAQALGYMAYYTVQKDMLDECRTYCTQLLKLEPDNGLGQKIMKFLNQKK